MSEQDKSELLPDGSERPDPRPMFIPLKRNVPLAERVRSLVRNELLARELDEQGIESFEEADDFNVEEDPPDPTTPYEENFDPEHPGITAKMQEEKAGFSEPLSHGKKEHARAVIEAHKRSAKKVDLEPQK